jgi:hypothetical protein
MNTLTIIPATIDGAMLANIDVLRADKRNLAIGILADLEQLLPEIDALYRTVRLLHRSRELSLTTDGEEQ